MKSKGLATADLADKTVLMFFRAVFLCERGHAYVRRARTAHAAAEESKATWKAYELQHLRKETEPVMGLGNEQNSPGFAFQSF